MDSIAAADRFIAAAGDHLTDGHGDLAELAALVEHVRLTNEMIDMAAKALLARNTSYREIGIALGLGRAAVERRYPGAAGRRPGGQPSNLR